MRFKALAVVAPSRLRATKVKERRLPTSTRATSLLNKRLQQIQTQHLKALQVQKQQIHTNNIKKKS